MSRENFPVLELRMATERQLIILEQAAKGGRYTFGGLLLSRASGTKKAREISTDVPRADMTQDSMIMTLKVILFLAFP